MPKNHHIANYCKNPTKQYRLPLKFYRQLQIHHADLSEPLHNESKLVQVSLLQNTPSSSGPMPPILPRHHSSNEPIESLKLGKRVVELKMTGWIVKLLT